jgi:chitinase
VSTPQNRQTLVNNIAALYAAYGLDGIDIDWEYPGQAGNESNDFRADDSTNFLAFLQLLRQTLPMQAKISAAAMTVPWADAHGQPMQDVRGFASVLDWILVMNYDTWGCECFLCFHSRSSPWCSLKKR